MNKRASVKAARLGGFLAQAGVRREPSNGRSWSGWSVVDPAAGGPERHRALADRPLPVADSGYVLRGHMRLALWVAVPATVGEVAFDHLVGLHGAPELYLAIAACFGTPAALGAWLNRRFSLAKQRSLRWDAALHRVLGRAAALQPRWDEQTRAHMAVTVNDMLWTAADPGQPPGSADRAVAALDDLLSKVSDLQEPSELASVTETLTWAEARRSALAELLGQDRDRKGKP